MLSLIILFASQTEKLFTFVETNPLENTETENKHQYCNEFGLLIERHIKRINSTTIDSTKRWKIALNKECVSVLVETRLGCLERRFQFLFKA